LTAEPGGLLLDEDGFVRPIASDDNLSETARLRFQVIPTDHILLAHDEFLVRSMFCKFSNGHVDVIPLNKSFMFKILPGELADDTIQRIVSISYFHTALLPLVELHTVHRILNGNEALDDVVSADDVLMIVLPHRLKTAAALRRAGFDPARTIYMCLVTPSKTKSKVCLWRTLSLPGQ
jgi:hypothetical protein